MGSRGLASFFRTAHFERDDGFAFLEGLVGGSGESCGILYILQEEGDGPRPLILDEVFQESGNFKPSSLPEDIK
jgi:hypothetical protein